MKFLYPVALYGLLLTPFVAAALWYLYRSHQDAVHLYFNKAAFKTYGLLPYGLWFLSWLFLVFALAAPAIPKQKAETQKVIGKVLYFVLDVSKSMEAKDLLPSRLAYAKRLIQQLLPQLQGDRVGIVLFSDYAYLLAPATMDFRFLQQTLQNATQGLKTRGTNLRSAIRKTMRYFYALDTSIDARLPKLMVVLSDGDGWDSLMIHHIKSYAQEQVPIVFLLCATKQGAMVEGYLSKPPIALLKQLREELNHFYFFHCPQECSPKALINFFHQKSMGQIQGWEQYFYESLSVPLAVVSLICFLMGIFFRTGRREHVRVF